MALLGWVPFTGLNETEQPRFIQNTSGRFESRFLAVKILPSPSILLKGMEESVLGIWCAHGEGRAYFPDKTLLDLVTKEGSDNLAPIRYVNEDHCITEEYPFNPNGSPHGIAGLCSLDGRHTAIMPHPERSVFGWQWGYGGMNGGQMVDKGLPSPWMKLFQNARKFSEEI